MNESHEPIPDLREFMDFHGLTLGTELLIRAYLIQQAVEFAFGDPSLTPQTSMYDTDGVRALREAAEKTVAEYKARFVKVSLGAEPSFVEIAAFAFGTMRAWIEEDQLRRLAQHLALQMLGHDSQGKNES